MMLRKNGMRHPQSRNSLPAIRLNASAARFARNSPAGTPNCGQGGNETAMMVGSRPLHGQQHRAAPLAADPDTLDETQDGQDDRTPDADLRISRHERDEKRRNAH